jgi:hypothetical protein
VVVVLVVVVVVVVVVVAAGGGAVGYLTISDCVIGCMTEKSEFDP